MTLSYDQQMRMQASARTYQTRYDDAFAVWDMRAPGPIVGETPDAYRTRLAILAKKQLPPDHQYRKMQWKQLDADAFAVMEPQLLREVKQEALNPMTVPLGQFRMVPEIDSNGLKMHRFIGQESFVKAMGRPGRRVKSFRRLTDFSGRPC
jgi:hypothetical protein